MDINKCPNCQKQYDQDRRVSKKLPCGCVSCLKCLKNVYQFIKKIECIKHQQVNNINPEDLQDYVVQEQLQLQVLAQSQEKSIDQEQISEQFRCLQDQYVQKLNQNSEIIKVIQDSALFMKYIQQLAIKEIHKSLIEQFSMSNEKIKIGLQCLSELQEIYVVQQQQQKLILGQKNPHERQNPQGQQQQQFQKILFEINELKKEQQMDIKSLRVNVQRCMFDLFIYLSENSGVQLLSDNEAELLIQKYFKQFKVIRGLSQVSSSVVQQKSLFKSQSRDYQTSQEIQINNYQNQNQVIDNQQGQDIVQDYKLLVPQEIFLQEKQIIYTRSTFQQLEQKLINIQNDISFNNQVNYLCQEQKILNLVPIPPDIITFEKLVQFLNQIKEENVIIQFLMNSLLNKSGLLEQTQILQQLSTVTDQQICLKLIEVLNLSKKQTQIQQAAANSITMLNFMNFDFTNQDFANLDLSNSDLSDTTFTSCNFANSNLTQVNLRNSKFLNCDFTSSNLTSIITEQPHIFTGHSNPVTSISISSDSEFIISGSYQAIILWDVNTGKSSTVIGSTSSVYAVAISSDQEFIVSGSRDKTVRLWDVKTGSYKTMSGHTSSVYAVVISSDSEFIVFGSYDCTIILWDVKTGTYKTMSGHTSYVTTVAISSDSEFIVSGSKDSIIILWKIKTGNSQIMSGHSGTVFSVSISNDSQYIVSGSVDKTIRLWSTKTLECIKVFSGHSSDVLSVIFSSSNSQIISGSKDKTIRV